MTRIEHWSYCNLVTALVKCVEKFGCGFLECMRNAGNLNTGSVMPGKGWEKSFQPGSPDRCASHVRVQIPRQSLVRSIQQAVLGFYDPNPAVSGVDGAPIFRTPVFSLRMGYRTGRFELYAAQRPARCADFFLAP